ncbi:MAG: hypothetical protein AVDCRST_MAG59-4966, partial [uncultured Thermomicrobiales bacterium]
GARKPGRRPVRAGFGPGGVRPGAGKPGGPRVGDRPVAGPPVAGEAQSLQSAAAPPLRTGIDPRTV